MPNPFSDPSNAGGWVLNPLFSDEFDGTTLDATKWNSVQTNNDCSMGATGLGWSGRQPSYFSPGNAVVANGCLGITMSRDLNSASIPTCAGRQGYKGYLAACVNSIHGASYGYYEAKIKAMKSSASSAFWFAGNSKTSQGYGIEIDVLETAAMLEGKGTGPGNDIFESVHLWDVNNNDVVGSLGVDGTLDYPPPYGVADDFHVYGIDWNANTITWYVDGVQKRQQANVKSLWNGTAQIVFDTELFADWFGTPTDATLPSTMLIDYIRAWTHGTVPPTPVPPPVVKKTPVITLLPNVVVREGQFLVDLATSDVPGAFVYSPAFAPHTAGSLHVTLRFTPRDMVNYYGVTMSDIVTVRPRRHRWSR